MAFDRNSNNKANSELPEIKITKASKETVYDDESLRQLSIKNRTNVPFTLPRGRVYSLHEKRREENTKISSKPASKELLRPLKNSVQMKSPLAQSQRKLFQQKRSTKKASDRTEVFLSDCRCPTNAHQKKRIEDLKIKPPVEVYFSPCSTEDLRVPQIKIGPTKEKIQKVFAASKAFNKKKVEEQTPKPVSLGHVVEHARASDDVVTTVKDRLTQWPEGDEILSLLYLVKTDQSCSSFRKPVIRVPSQFPNKSSSVNHADAKSVASGNKQPSKTSTTVSNQRKTRFN